MEEHASFETRAVLAPRRARLSRFALLLPVVALVAIAWAGVSGAGSDQATADRLETAAAAAESPAVQGPSPAAAVVPRSQQPPQALGLDVHRLDEVQPRAIGRDDLIAVAGWYVVTAINDCPPLATLFRPDARDDFDSWAYCDRSGWLYAERPGREEEPTPTGLEHNGTENAGLLAVPVRLLTGVVLPPELEMIGAEAAEVVVIGHFVESGDRCSQPFRCRSTLVIDHVAWTSGA